MLEVQIQKSEKQHTRQLLTKYTENKGVVGEIYQNIVLNWRDEGIDIQRL